VSERPEIASPKTNDYFSTEHLEKNLKQRSVRGGAIMIVAQAAKFILQMGSTIFLARFLSPNDYGLVGMTTVLLNFVRLFRDLGLSSATIQREKIEHQQVSTLFWINVAFGCVICLIISLTSPLVANFYNEPRLILITLSLASVFIFSGLTVQHQALLKRQMYFRSLVTIEIIALTIGLGTGIILAWIGFGYWTLVLMPIVKAVLEMIGVWVVCDWRPGLPRWSSEVASMLAFGSNLTGFNSINYFSRNLDNILIGRYWGAVELGLYAKAYQLVLLPILQINVPVNSVVLPTLSRLQQQPAKYTRYYYQAILAITFLGMPVVAFLFATTEKLIPFLLGEQWLGVIPIFRYLMPAAFMGTFTIAGGWVYQSLDRTDRQLKIGLIGSSIDVAIFLFSIRWGAIGVAAAYGLSRPLVWLPSFMYCYHDTPLKISKLLQTIAYPAFASLAAAGIVMGVNQFFPVLFSRVETLFLDSIIYGISYLTLWTVLPSGRRTLTTIWQTISNLKQKK
jgi:O-antigen/teichoic acid export membrane protein